MPALSHSLLPLTAVAVLATAQMRASDPPPVASKFIGDHCAVCHNEVEYEARLDLTNLKFNPEDPVNFALWVRIHDRVKAGEMPPKRMDRPTSADLEAFLKTMTESLVEAQRTQFARDGRAVQRRLNRYEYENALRDLLNVPWAQVKDKLPDDGEAYRFNKSGEALDVSFVQMERFMSAADYAMRLAMATASRAAGEDRPQALRPRRASLELAAARERHAARPAVVPGARFACAAGRPRRPRARRQPRDARARGGRQGVEHLQRRGRLYAGAAAPAAAGRYRIAWGYTSG